MIYRVFYHDKLVSAESSIKDTFYFIKTRHYEIIDSIEHINNSYINIYCIQEVSMQDLKELFTININTRLFVPTIKMTIKNEIYNELKKRGVY